MVNMKHVGVLYTLLHCLVLSQCSHAVHRSSSLDSDQLSALDGVPIAGCDFNGSITSHALSSVGGGGGGVGGIDGARDVISPVVVRADVDTVYSCRINRSLQFIFVYPSQRVSQKLALRASVNSSAASLQYPLLLAVRQQLGIRSWTLPQSSEHGHPPRTYAEVNKTVCPVQSYISDVTAFGSQAAVSRDVFLEVSTISTDNIPFSLVLRRQSIYVGIGRPVEATVSPSSARFFRFDFPAGVAMVLVKATSVDDFCTSVSVQNTSCPVYDTEQDITHATLYQTMTLQAGITVSRERFPHGVFIVFVVHGDDRQCSETFVNIEPSRQKHIRIEIQEKISRNEYLAAIFGALGFFSLFYLLSIVLSVWHYIRQRREWRHLSSNLPSEVSAETSHAPSTSSASVSGAVLTSSPRQQNAFSAASAADNTALIDSSSDDSERDAAEGPSSAKEQYRQATPFVCVSELARKRPRVLSRRTRLFSWSVVTVALFYGVPVIQLVYTYQKILNETGDQDTCYYNFWCSHPLGVLTDFNHVFSNIGYVLLGLLFIGLVKRRQLVHRLHLRSNDRIEQDCGIPRHFGLFYAMGVALMMEGVLSACYHVCPSKSDFQFDTAFMYVIAVLCMLRIYETRHADISASAYATFLMLACTMVVSVVGVWQGGAVFWTLFLAVYMCACVLLTVHFYYMGRWSCPGWRCICDAVTAWHAAGVTSVCRPRHMARCVLLVLANCSNAALAFYGAFTRPADFASYLLAIFITNLLLYTFFYIVMKLRHREKLLLQPLLYVVLCGVSWLAAFYFFLHKSTSWRVPAAQSRVHNRPCLLLNFYDDHDVWHFLSASSMFFGFMILLTWDDDLVFTQRDLIPVF